MLDDVDVFSGDTEPNSLCVQGSVAHEVADELGELWRHCPRHARARVRGPVELTKRRQRNLVRLADEAVEHQRDAVALANLGEALPGPVAVLVDDLDPVG